MRSLAKYSCVSWPSTNARGGQIGCVRTHMVKVSKTELNAILELENKDCVFEIILRGSKDDSKIQRHYLYLLKQGEILK